MSRPLRIEYPDAVYHVTSRGNARNDIFHADQDRKEFLSMLDRVVQRFNWKWRETTFSASLNALLVSGNCAVLK